MMVFKAALYHKEYDVLAAVWMILAVSALLTSLAVYGYLGSKTETLLMQLPKSDKKEKTPLNK